MVHNLCFTNFPNFRSLKDNILRAQPLDKQQIMAQWFDDLMSGIERSVSSKNKEKYGLKLKPNKQVKNACIKIIAFICIFFFRFTHNLSSFRRDVVNLPKMSNYSTGSSFIDDL